MTPPIDKALFTSDKQDWGTPRSFYDRLDAEFAFTIDLCAHALNHKHPRYYTVEQDALSQDWSKEVGWLNPPYDEVERWMAYAYEMARKGGTFVVLVPSRTDTGWWHEFVHGRAHEVRLVRGRLRFEGAPTSAPFPSAVIVYRPGPAPESTHYTRMDARAPKEPKAA